MKRNVENSSSKRKAIRISLLVLSLLLLAGAVGVSAKYIAEKKVQGGTIPANVTEQEDPSDPDGDPDPNGSIRTTEPGEKPTETVTDKPTEAPTEEPTEAPTEEPTEEPTEAPTEELTEEPTEEPEEGSGSHRE